MMLPLAFLPEKRFMLRALELAKEAAKAGEVPVGAVVVKNGQILGEGRNRREEDHTALAHAEMEAITSRWNPVPCARGRSSMLMLTVWSTAPMMTVLAAVVRQWIYFHCPIAIGQRCTAAFMRRRPKRCCRSSFKEYARNNRDCQNLILLYVIKVVFLWYMLTGAKIYFII